MKISFVFASPLWLTPPWSLSSSLSGLSLLASFASTSKRVFIYSPPPVESLLPPAPPELWVNVITFSQSLFILTLQLTLSTHTGVFFAYEKVPLEILYEP